MKAFVYFEAFTQVRFERFGFKINESILEVKEQGLPSI